MRLPLLILAATALHGATVANVACGSAGDMGFSGVGSYAYALAGQSAPYNAMRASAAPFSYTFSVAPGTYSIKLSFIEPRATQVPGARKFNIDIGGVRYQTGFDIFAIGGTLAPLDATYRAAFTGPIIITFTPVVGNVIVSGIQIDSVDAPPPPTGALPWQCAVLLGDGSSVMGAWPYMIAGCENMSGRALNVIRVRCRSNIAGQIADLLAMDGTGHLKSLLVAPFECTPEGAAGVLLPGASYADGDVLRFAVRIVPLMQNASEVLLTMVAQ